jgi:hypothetical protein
MSNNNELISMPDFVESIKTKVKEQFINAIPEDKINGFITQTVNEFLEKELKKIVTDELSQICKDYIKDQIFAMSTGGWGQNPITGQWETIVNGKIKQLLVEMAPAMMQSIFGQMAQQVFQSMSYGR